MSPTAVTGRLDADARRRLESAELAERTGWKRYVWGRSGDRTRMALVTAAKAQHEKMKFALDYVVCIVSTKEQTFPSAALVSQVDAHREDLGAPADLEGTIVVTFDGRNYDLEISEPLVRLIDAFLRRLPWVIGGDVETVALRNSEQCFGFTPSGEAVEVAFFNGTEAEIEDYVIEPATVRLDLLVPQMLGLGERLVALVGAIDAAALESDEDCQALARSLREARDAWKEYQRQRR